MASDSEDKFDDIELNEITNAELSEPEDESDNLQPFFPKLRVSNAVFQNTPFNKNISNNYIDECCCIM